MDPQYIERIRSATFRVARRGYDKREVDRFLAQLAEWLETGGEDDARAETVRHELERIGQQTAKILTDAHDVAEGLRSESEQIAKQARDEADAYATKTRSEAEAHAERVRIEADEYAGETRGAAEADASRVRGAAEAEAAEKREQAEQLAEEMSAHAAHRRRELEASINRLEERRAAVLAEMDRLSSELSGTATSYRPEDVDDLEPEEIEGPDFENAYQADDEDIYDEATQVPGYESEDYADEDETVVVEVDETEPDGDEPPR